MTTVSWDQVLRWRIHRQFLAGDKGRDPIAVARRLSGVHAQVAASSVAALDLRTKAATTAAKVDTLLYEKRALVRTWAARGTLHLLPSDDLPTWVAAMSTRTRETTGSWLRYYGVTASQMADILAALPEVLDEKPLSREELADAIIGTTGYTDLREPLIHGFGSLLKPAAFRGLLCSGPPRGRTVTFVAPRAWLGDWEPVDTDKAVDALALAYLGAYGPATADEFARWFDLKPALAKRSFARLEAAGTLAHVNVEGAPGVLPEDELDALTTPRPTGEPTVLLLPAFDPYVVASTRQLEHIGAAGHKADVSRPQGWISATLVVDGWIRGVWEARDGGSPVVTAFGPLSPQVKAGIPTTNSRPSPKTRGPSRS